MTFRVGGRPYAKLSLICERDSSDKVLPELCIVPRSRLPTTGSEFGPLVARRAFVPITKPVAMNQIGMPNRKRRTR